MNASVRVFALLGLFASLAASAAQAADDVPAEVEPAEKPSLRDDAAEPPSATKPGVSSDDGFHGVRAEERDARPGTPLIQSRLFSLENRFELGAAYDMNLTTKYIDLYGGHINFGYHFFEWLGVEGYAGYLGGGENNLAKKIRQTGRSHERQTKGLPCPQPTCEPEIPDLWQTTWFAGAHAEWAPFYGKLSLASEYDLSFQFYGRLGAALQGIRKATNALDNGVTVFEPNTPFSTQLRVAADYGIGLRLIPWEHVAVRIEFVNYTGINPDVPEHTDVQGENDARCRDGLGGYILDVGGEPKCYVDYTTDSMFQVGLTYIF